jgi:hypothetical protein
LGSETLVIGIDVVPFRSLMAPAGKAAATGAVASEVDVFVPNAFLAVRATRNRCPTSADFHWYVNVIGAFPVQVPVLADSVWPS